MITLPALLLALAAAAETPRGGVHGDWTVQCTKAADVPPCEIAQAATSKSTGEQIMRIAFAYRGSGERYAVQIRLPLGVRLSQAPLLRLDENSDLEGYAFTRCDAGGCYIERMLGTPEITRLRAAKAGVLAVLGSDGKPMVLPLSFNGFAEALDASALQNTAWAKAANR
ncbi:invasion associated locus B family protein [Sphingosinicella soli]|uniref:Invasion protein IalB n=1 Tax=Sphingosinicella soli TaxID=333708 RepID=A0A7W7F9R5_9SPHN|nr:invasion associated locus B family protein [Sphingosinicella soli]MBB4632918.1 invasion protein IalB [Sphingosinicella soli]